MTITTETYWDIDGVPLHTLGYNIETLEGLLRMPKVRGEDIVIPYAVGETYVPKVVGSRVLTFRMWIIGADEDGTVPANRKAEFQKNLAMLQELFFRVGEEFIITKRFYDKTGTLKTVRAKGSYNGGMDPTMMGFAGGKFTVDVKLTNPYFYDLDYTTFNLVNGHQDITVSGNQMTLDIKLTINGPRTMPELINWTTNLDDLKYTRAGGLLTGTRVEIEVPSWQARYYPVSGPFQDASGFIQSSGHPRWFALKAGVNDIEVKATAGAGSIQLQAKGAYL